MKNAYSDPCRMCDAIRDANLVAFVTYYELLKRNCTIALWGEGIVFTGETHNVKELLWQVRDHYADIYVLVAHLKLVHITPIDKVNIVIDKGEQPEGVVS